MLDLIRRKGLVFFMLALAVVSLFKAVAGWPAGRYAGWAGVALLMAALAAWELERREMVKPSPYLYVLRWAGILGALGILLWEA